MLACVNGLKGNIPTGEVIFFRSFVALVYISLADATAIGYAAPLFTVILAALCTAVSSVQIRFLNGIERPGAIAGLFTVWSEQRQRKLSVIRTVT